LVLGEGSDLRRTVIAIAGILEEHGGATVWVEGPPVRKFAKVL
jgi:hypothetical protein